MTFFSNRLTIQIQNFTPKFIPQPKGGWFIPVEHNLTGAEKNNFETHLRQIIEKLGEGIEQLEINATSIKGEWQGSGKLEKQQGVGEERPYFPAVDDAPVILYLHGGGYIAGTAESERKMTYKFAELCQGRVFALNYRLAPQSPFPAALMDAFIAYKYLTDPPPTALHKAVDPQKIVIGGDSAGVNVVIR